MQSVSPEKLAVTGLGIVSALGTGVEETYNSLLHGSSPIGKIRHLKTVHADLPCAEVNWTDKEMKAILGVGDLPAFNRTTLMGLMAFREAWQTCALPPGLASTQRLVFINGTTVGGMEKSEQYYEDFLRNDSKNDYLAVHECGVCTETIADTSGITFDYVTTLSTACSSAANAIVLGADLIRSGQADVAVVGGSECLTRFHLNGFHALLILDPEPCRPFDETRKGLNLGEGAAYLVLERPESARRRGAAIQAYLSGYGNACDAFHQTASSDNGEGPARAMRQALTMSGINPALVDYINAHGTGTPNNDYTEGKAIEQVFGKTIPPVGSTKSMTGHTTSAAGSVEAVISILALSRGVIPGNLRLQQPIRTLSFEPIRATLRNQALRHVMSNSFGFGGNDTALLFSKTLS